MVTEESISDRYLNIHLQTAPFHTPRFLASLRTCLATERNAESFEPSHVPWVDYALGKALQQGPEQVPLAQN